MTCEYEYSSTCLSSEKDYHWLWILLPISILIILILYIFSRPNYARLSTRTYQLINQPKNSNALQLYKHENNVYNQHVQCRRSLSSSDIKSDQYKRKVEHENNSLIRAEKKDSIIIDHSKLLAKSSMSNNRSNHSLNDNETCHRWNEHRTPILTNYPDLIDIEQARQDNNKFNLQTNNNHTLLSDDIRKLIDKGFDNTNSCSNKSNLGRIWFFLEYNPYLRQLYLTIIKARNLHSTKTDQPTTFVRAEIIPKLNITFATKIFQENANPDYMTDTIFHINLCEFSENVLKLTVHEIDKETFHIPIGTTYYPLDHLLIAQRAKGHAVWRDLLPEYGDPSAVGLIQIRATVWYNDKDEYLNIYVHSLRTVGTVKQICHVYVHVSVALLDLPVIPEEHIEFAHNERGPIVSLKPSNETNYDQLFRFNIYKHEFIDMTVVLDVYRRSFGDQFFNDILLGRTVLVSPQMLDKKRNNETTKESLMPIDQTTPIVENEQSNKKLKRIKHKRNN